METQELKSIVEALIFAADEPLSEARIRETLELENGFDFSVLIDTLNQEYQDGGRAFTIRKIAGGYQIVTQQSYSNWIKKLYLGRQKNRLSHAALETLALIAFKQPISRVDIGQIRGVNSDGVIGTLLERKLITITGRSEAVGRPLLYSTTPEFLKYFGINDITDLPKPREIEELFSKEGMPEELLQALSQTDAQLSLPINADGETAAAPDETENKDKITEAPTSSEPSATIEAPIEVEETPVSESTTEPVVEPVFGEAETAVLTPEISGVDIDINEKVVTQLEATSDGATEHLTVPVPAPESENEIAWISLNSEADHAVEETASHEFVIDDLTETVNELSTFAGVAEVAAKQVTEQPATNEFALVTLTETANELPTFANVDEIVSHTLAVEDKNDIAAESETMLAALESMTEEIAADFVSTDAVTGEVTESFVAGVDEVVAMVAESPATEVQVIEAYDVGLTDIESPPTEQRDTSAEVDGWMAEELSQEEIAEPDFMKKSGDFFLEEEPQPSIDLSSVDLMTAIDAEAPTALLEAEPIVVSNTELSAVADEAFLNFDDATPETEHSFTITADENAEISPAPKTSNLTETAGVAEISEASPEPSGNVAVVDFPEPTIIASVPEVTAKVIDDTAADEKLEPINFDTTPAVSTHEEFVTADAPSAMPELTTTAQSWRDEEVNLTVAEVRPEIVSAPVFENEMALPDDEDNRPATLRTWVVGWFKRTFNKLLALIGATGENE